MHKRTAKQAGNLTLNGLQVVVSRPEQQAQRLATMLSEQGAEAHVVPALQIEPVPCTRVMFDCLATADIVIFISPNAVEHTLNCVERFGQWPTSILTLAVGPGTRDALFARGVAVGPLPATFNTHGLLALNVLSDPSVRSKQLLIFRGVGGLATLGEELTERGASVTYCEVYRRQPIKNSPKCVNLRGTRGEIDIIVVTSVAVLHALVAMFNLPSGHWLRMTPLVVASERVAKVARDLHWQAEIVVAPSATDDDVMATLVAWCKETKETTG